MKKKYYALTIVSIAALGLIMGFIYVYMQAKGISYSYISFCIFLFWCVSVVFEIPSAVLSDIYGRRSIYVFSMMFRALGIFLIWKEQYLIGFVIAGIAEALASGCLQAWIFDSVEKTEIPEVSIMTSRYSFLVSGTIGLLGPVMYFRGYEVYLFTFSVTLFLFNAVIAFLFMKESPKFLQQNHRKLFSKYKNICLDVKLFFTDNKKECITVLFIGIIAISTAAIPYSYYQILFTEYSSANLLIISIPLLTIVASFLGTLIYKKIDLKNNRGNFNRLIFLFLFLVLFESILLSPYFTFLVYFFHVVIAVILEIFILSFLHELIKDSRNTLSSIFIFIQSVTTSLLLFSMSVLLNYFSVSWSQVIVVTCCSIGTFVLGLYRRSVNEKI